MDDRGKVYKELLLHFNCSKCTKYWSISGGIIGKYYYCPHCGYLQKFNIVRKKL